MSVEAAEEPYLLSQDEDETTRYITGYIIFSLKNLMKGKKSVKAVATRQMLSYSPAAWQNLVSHFLTFWENQRKVLKKLLCQI